MKYYIEIDLSRNGLQSDYNALSKARIDVARTLESCGWKKMLIKGSSLFGTRISKMIAIAKAILIAMTLGKKDTVLFQYPDYYAVHEYVARFFKDRGVKVDILIHDLDHLRSDWRSWEKEKAILEQSDCIYVHTPAMVEYMVSGGMDKAKLVPLYLFDYYSDDTMFPIDVRMKTRIAYAGNLVKSRFVNRLSMLFGNTAYRICLYGLKTDELVCSESVSYEGCFTSDHPGMIQAGWGLVWDGDSVDTCSGRYGEYLHYNSSHKLSLYLACGLPVIVWTQSSLASWVVENRIGIAVASLADVPALIDSLTEDEYISMCGQARKIGEDLRKGEYLRRRLS